MGEEFKICFECTVDTVLKEEILSMANVVNKCDFCGRRDIYGLNEATIEDVKPYFEAYVAYNFSQENWDGRYGSRNYASTILEENLFFNWTSIKHNDRFSTLIDTIAEQDHDTLILNDHWASPWSLRDEENHELLLKVTKEDDFKKKLIATSDLIKNAEFMIKNKTIQLHGYRARIGCNKIKGQFGRDINTPYKGKDIGVAPKGVIGSGRANRAFCGFLYLAEDINTSVLEVRAQQGDFVSLGKFKSRTEIKIFDLTDPNIWNYKGSYTDVKKLSLISAINTLFSKPVGNGSNEIYLDTQLIVEEIIRKNYDGICFRSSFTGRNNFTLFNSNLMNEVEGQEELVKVEKVEVTLINQWDNNIM